MVPGGASNIKRKNPCVPDFAGLLSIETELFVLVQTRIDETLSPFQKTSFSGRKTEKLVKS
jgi:hypothetical protein